MAIGPRSMLVCLNIILIGYYPLNASDRSDCYTRYNTLSQLNTFNNQSVINTMTCHTMNQCDANDILMYLTTIIVELSATPCFVLLVVFLDTTSCCCTIMYEIKNIIIINIMAHRSIIIMKLLVNEMVINCHFQD